MSLPQLTLLSSADRALIHQSSLELLEDVGVEFQSARARNVLQDAGCSVADGGRVRIPRELVKWAVDQQPRDVLLAGRDESRDIHLDGTGTYCATAGICPNIVDSESGLYRSPNLEDLERATRLADSLDAFGFVMYPISPNAGTSPEMTDLSAVACMLAHTTKHVMGQVLQPSEVPYILEMLRLCGAADRPVFSIVYCPVSPLQHVGGAVEAAMALAEERVPIDIFSVGLAGATAPVTLAGTITQTNCEVLSAVVLFQLVAPGCPLIYSANAGIMDMRTALPAVSAPETILMNVAQVELAHSYNMPALSVGHVSDSRYLAFRGGVEDMSMALATRLARPDLMIGLGTLESGNAVSLEKMVLDAELVGYLDRIIEGFAIDPAHVAVNTIAEVGPGGHYLGQRDTRRYLRSGEHWVPRLLDRSMRSEREGLASSEIERAKGEVQRLLAEHIPSPLPPDARELIAEVLARAQSALGVA